MQRATPSNPTTAHTTTYTCNQPTTRARARTQVSDRYPPVFHHWFLEACPDPAAWFEARTRYTRSTAVASMAGAIIGLGDRHLGNILLDLSTAEVRAGACGGCVGVCVCVCERLAWPRGCDARAHVCVCRRTASNTHTHSAQTHHTPSPAAGCAHRPGDCV
jgi:hypothetical protein